MGKLYGGRDLLEELEIARDIEQLATKYAITHLVSTHIQEIRDRKEELIQKTILAVKDRLTKEINYWDYRAVQLSQEEAAGRSNVRLMITISLVN